MPRIKCIATDFDFTQSHFRDPIEKGFFNIMRRRGWNDADISEVRNYAEAQGFSLENFFKAAVLLKPKLPIGDAASIRLEFYWWLEESIELYQDARPFLEKWWGAVPIAIITAGDQFYQRRKVNLVHPPYDELHVVSPPHRKVDVLADLLDRRGAPLLFIEDRPDELDAALLRLGEHNVITVLVLRPDSPYNGERPRYNHIQVRSLEEMNALIEEAG